MTCKISASHERMKSIRVIILFALFIQCKGKIGKEAIETNIAQHDWKYAEGASIGDWIDFKSGYYEIKYDTLFRNDSAVAIVSHLKVGKVGDDDEMEIVLINNNMKGTYYSK